MTRLNRFVASALVVGCAVVCSRFAGAQPPASGLSSPPAASKPGETSGSLEGVVTDDGGRPLAGVAVTVQGSRFAYVVSDREGRFAFDALHPGPYVVRAQMPGYVASERSFVNVLPSAAAWQRLTLRRLSGATSAMGDGMGRAVMTAGFAQPAVGEVAGQNDDEAGDHDDGATAWRLRHLKRSVLRDTTEREDTIDGDEGTEVESYVASDIGQAPLAAELWSGLPLSGQVQLLTTSTFDRPEELFASSMVRGVAYVTVTAPVGQRGTWAVQGAVTQGDLSSWVLGGTYAGRLAAAHSLDAGLSYAAQRYVGPNALTFVTLEDGSRTVGAMFAFDEWSLNPKATLKYGAHYARYGYLADPGLFSPSVNLRWAVGPRVWLHATAARQMLAPGAEEFIPSSVAGMWLPPQRTFSSVSPDGRFRAEEARHLELAMEREVASFVFTARGFREDVDNQIVTLFGASVPGQPIADPGHYFTANAGRLSAFGWGVAVSRPVASRLRGSVSYTVTHGLWHGGAGDTAVLALLAPSSLRQNSERIQDVTTVVETDIPETATRVYAAYRFSTGFATAAADSDDPELDARFDVQVSQRLPFLAFTNAQWELLLAVRNMFRDLEAGAFYDELLVIRPPKRIVGGLTVRF